AFLLKDHTAIYERHRILRVKLDSLIEVLDCAVVLALGVVRYGAVGKCQTVERIEFDRLSILLYRSFVVSATSVRSSPTVVGIAESAVFLQCLLKEFNAFIALSTRNRMDTAQI